MLARNLTADVPANVDRIFISIHDPVVVAVSDEPAEYSNGYFMLFNYEANWEKEHKLRRLFVLRDWPRVVGGKGIPEGREVLSLTRPMTRGEVMESRPWEQDSAAKK